MVLRRRRSRAHSVLCVSPSVVLIRCLPGPLEFDPKGAELASFLCGMPEYRVHGHLVSLLRVRTGLEKQGWLRKCLSRWLGVSDPGQSEAGGVDPVEHELTALE